MFWFLVWMEEITFGNFSNKEIQNLFHSRTETKLEFGWQKQLQKETDTEDVHNILLPVSEMQKNSLGSLSPDFSTNQPESLIKTGIGSYYDSKKSLSKLNVNAIPFTPSNVGDKIKSSISATSTNGPIHVTIGGVETNSLEALSSGVGTEKLSVKRDAEQSHTQIKSSHEGSVAINNNTSDGNIQGMEEYHSVSTSCTDRKQYRQSANEDGLFLNKSLSDFVVNISTEESQSVNAVPPNDDLPNAACIEMNLSQAFSCSNTTPAAVQNRLSPVLPSSQPAEENDTPVSPVHLNKIGPLCKDNLGSVIASIAQDSCLVKTDEDRSKCVSTSKCPTAVSNSFSLPSSSPHLAQPLPAGLTSSSCTLTSPCVISPPRNMSTPPKSNSSTKSETESPHPQSTSTSSTAPGNVWENKSKSWASVVSKQPSYNHTPIVSSTLYKVEGSKVTGDLSLSVRHDVSSLEQLDIQNRNSQLKELADKLIEWQLNQEPVCIQPRGLINQANWCYMHAPLQALLGFPGFYNLFRSIDNSFPTLSKEPSSLPIVDAMVQFVREFKPYPKAGTPVPTLAAPLIDPKSKKKRSLKQDLLLHGDSFKPDFLYSMLLKIKSNLSYKGRQEDAEEFLGYILGGLHEEMVSAKTALLADTKSSDTQVEDHDQVQTSFSSGEVGDPVRDPHEAEEWEQVGPKNRSTITRQTSFQESPITEIFGGELRSSVHRQKAKESATVQPFFSLQLDIQPDDIWTLKDALEALSIKETVHMSEVEAHKRITLARLPPVLILHLKRFVFDKTGGSQKLMKQVQYSTELDLNKDLLSPAIRNKLTPSQRTYRLWAIVYHHGKTATGGHYTCDVYHPAAGGWVRADDGLVKLVPEDYVLKTAGPSKVAYIIFYRRLDTIQ